MNFCSCVKKFNMRHLKRVKLYLDNDNEINRNFTFLLAEKFV